MCVCMWHDQQRGMFSFFFSQPPWSFEPTSMAQEATIGEWWHRLWMNMQKHGLNGHGNMSLSLSEAFGRHTFQWQELFVRHPVFMVIWLVVWRCLKPSEKYDSQLEWLFPIYGKIQNVPNHHFPLSPTRCLNHQPVIYSDRPSIGRPLVGHGDSESLLSTG